MNTQQPAAWRGSKKSYDVRRGPECPSSLHEPFGAEDNPCTCPWMVIRAENPDGRIVVMKYSRKEVETLIREADRGFFDPSDYPQRPASMFLGAHMQHLMDTIETRPAMAAMMLMTGGFGVQLIAVAYAEASQCLSLQFQPTNGDPFWHRLWLATDPDDQTIFDAGPEPGGDGDGNEFVLWRRPQYLEGEIIPDSMRADLRGQVRAITASRGPDPADGWQPYNPDDEPKEEDSDADGNPPA